MELSARLAAALVFAASQLSGSVRRAFMAMTVEALGPGGQRLAQRELGWDRDTIRKGAAELRSGDPGIDWRRFNGPEPSIVVRLPDLRKDLREVVEPHAHADPKLTSDRVYCRLSVAGIVGALIEHKGYSSIDLPCDEAIRKMLDGMDYCMRKVRKSKPSKKVPEADLIFETVSDLNRQADACDNDETLRLSLDTKARVKVGEFSRGGYSRAPRSALDHDFEPDAILVPMGIFVPKYDELHIDLYPDRAPADAWVDSLEGFWQREGHRFPATRQLLLNLDNGPENSSHRTQFMARLVQFVENTGLLLTLAYYPPYQSKYNGVERCWGVLENHWAGELLDSVEAVVGFASTMTYNGVRAAVRLVEKAYEKGVKLSRSAMAQVNGRMQRATGIPKYLVTIGPAVQMA
jgi:hypothetical protein